MNEKLEKEGPIYFSQGGREFPFTDEHLEPAEKRDKTLSGAKKKLEELITTKNINFLLGAGTSSPCIPVMQDMQNKVEEALAKEKDNVFKKLYDDLKAKKKNNLEDILGVLFSAENCPTDMIEEKWKGQIEPLRKKVLSVMIKIVMEGQEEREFCCPQALNPSNSGPDSKGDDKKKCDRCQTLETYKTFYTKIALRNKDLARVNVFTTNYDLLNEMALDESGINYNNGFGGGLKRTFNPARFGYTLSRKIDMNLEKFEPSENMVYLYKLHGSVNWISKDGNSLFDVEEITINRTDTKDCTNNAKNCTKDTNEGAKTESCAKETNDGAKAESCTKETNDSVRASEICKEDTKNRKLIYPTPHKQGESLGHPYSELLREFQHKLWLPNSVLFVIGYSFSDVHINNIIYQALTANSSLSVFIFGGDELKGCKIWNPVDSRIYWLHGYEKDSVRQEGKKDSTGQEGEKDSARQEGEKDSTGQEGEKMHFFNYIVRELLPQPDKNEDLELLKKLKSALQKVSDRK